MAAPTVLEKILQQFIKQGPVLRDVQRRVTDLCSRVVYLERKRGRSSSCDRDTSERNISKKRKLLENESESDEDSDIEISNEETPHHIPDTQQLSTSMELDTILSDGELDSEDVKLDF